MFGNTMQSAQRTPRECVSLVNEGCKSAPWWLAKAIFNLQPIMRRDSQNEIHNQGHWHNCTNPSVCGYANSSKQIVVWSQQLAVHTHKTHILANWWLIISSNLFNLTCSFFLYNLLTPHWWLSLGVDLSG